MCKAMQRNDFEAVADTGESSTGGALEIVASATFGLHGLARIPKHDPPFTHENRDVTTEHVD